MLAYKIWCHNSQIWNLGEIQNLDKNIIDNIILQPVIVTKILPSHLFPLAHTLHRAMFFSLFFYVCYIQSHVNVYFALLAWPLQKKL